MQSGEAGGTVPGLHPGYVRPGLCMPSPPMPNYRPQRKDPAKAGSSLSMRDAYCGWATSRSLSLRLNCGNREPMTMPAMLNSRPASCGGQKASSVQLYSR